jgi:hypothetical protein
MADKPYNAGKFAFSLRKKLMEGALIFSNYK